MGYRLHLQNSWYSEKITDEMYLKIRGVILNEYDLKNKLIENYQLLLTDLSHLKGFYSFIVQQDNVIYASVDHVRSYPLFYAVVNDELYLSDSAEWIREELNNKEMDSLFRQEFLHAGFVSGRDTLCPEIKQLQAGEALKFENGILELIRHYEYFHCEPQGYNEKSLLKELYEVLEKSILNLISHANGRQIVVPLSGGYDSRLLVTMLKEIGYDNIIAFTYGVKANKEAQYSKIVAETLGIDWFLVEYTPELWEKAWSSSERYDFQIMASNYVSLPHPQDWLAVKLIKERNLVDEDAIFTPGHGIDFLSGCDLPTYVFDTNSTYTTDSLYKEILTSYYMQVPITDNLSYKNFIQRISDKLKTSSSILTSVEYADYFENWVWQEQETKYICNSVRVYEFFGYDWWMPLCDKALFDYFSALPLALRNHDWYQSFVRDLFARYTEKPLNNASDNKGLSSLLRKSVANNKMLYFIARAIYRKLIKNKVIPSTSTLFHLDSRYDVAQHDELLARGYTFYGIEAYFFLQEIDLKLNNQKLSDVRS